MPEDVFARYLHAAAKAQHTSASFDEWARQCLYKHLHAAANKRTNKSPSTSLTKICVLPRRRNTEDAMLQRSACCREGATHQVQAQRKVQGPNACCACCAVLCAVLCVVLCCVVCRVVCVVLTYLKYLYINPGGWGLGKNRILGKLFRGIPSGGCF